jgi:hypothetical protein
MTNYCDKCSKDCEITVLVFVRDEGRQLWCLKCLDDITYIVKKGEDIPDRVSWRTV